MTTTPETPANATDLAERALIGALLADPSRVEDVRDWLRPGDVHEPKARAIYQTLTDLHRQGRTVPIRELPVVIAADDGTHPTITAHDLYAYVQATPAAVSSWGRSTFAAITSLRSPRPRSRRPAHRCRRRLPHPRSCRALPGPSTPGRR